MASPGLEHRHDHIIWHLSQHQLSQSSKGQVCPPPPPTISCIHPPKLHRDRLTLILISHEPAVGDKLAQLGQELRPRAQKVAHGDVDHAWDVSYKDLQTSSKSRAVGASHPAVVLDPPPDSERVRGTWPSNKDARL